MIFPTESLLRLRGELEDRVSAGELSEVEAYREAVQADPEDPRALRLLALLAEDEGDFAGAEDLAWRWLRADPLSHEAFRLIGRLLGRDPARAARGAAYMALGTEKLHYDPEAEQEAAPAKPTGEESAEVAGELEPHRLLHEMWIASTGEIDPETIDRVLARAADMAPLLTGILNLYGEDLLDDVDDALVVRSLALLGEFGDPAALPAIARFLPLEDETFSHMAEWACERIAGREPAGALAEFGRLIPHAGAFDLACLAQQICTLPPMPGRGEALAAIEARVADFTDAERGAVAMGAIAAAYITDGADSELAARLIREHGAHLPGGARKELKSIRGQLKDEGPWVAQPDDTDIHDICCPPFEAAEDDEPYVRERPKLGRNDPCWCGSGQKYKKCHLAADEDR